MAKTQSFDVLRAKLDKLPDAAERRRVAQEELEEELRLYELRSALIRETQAALAEKLGVSQAAISKLENSGDPKISTLAAYIEALGGRLKISAEFDEGAVPLRLG